METENTTPRIISAVLTGQEGIVYGFICAGDDVNEPSESGLYAIIAAASLNDTEIVELLLDNGADPDVSDCYERTPLYWAKRYKNTEMKELIEAKLHSASMQLK